MPAIRNVRLYRWFKFLQSLLFWQAVWFLYFQDKLSAADALLLYAVYDISTTVLEVPSGILSDRLGRRLTLILSACASLSGTVMLATGDTFPALVVGQGLLGAGIAFASGTDEALLFESLEAAGQAERIERESLVAWRFGFAGLMVSAVTGGLVGYFDIGLTFWGTGVAFAAMVGVAILFREPPPSGKGAAPELGLLRLGQLREAFCLPALRWLFAISVLMYGYSHLPFVFGQPFILEALGRFGLAAEAPVVSGAVTAVMMAVSLLASLIAPGLRERFGLARLMLFAFGIQIALAALLAASDSLIVVGFLILRMVPSALSRPFLIARIQPLLQHETRATYLSLQSLAGRIAFAASIWLASAGADSAGAMRHSEIQLILGAYALAGLACLLILAGTAHAVQRRPGGTGTAR